MKNGNVVSTLLGLARDLIAAIVGLLIVSGVDVSWVVGILLLVATTAALGSWVYMARQQPTDQGTTLATPAERSQARAAKRQK